MEVSAEWCGLPLLAALAEDDLHGVVAVDRRRLALHDAARPGFEHGDRQDGAPLGEELGHAHLACQDAFAHSLISMLTPDGRLRRISASTTLGLGSRMSTIRLWVRISNCSRESLSMNGERITVILLISVGSGMGPAVRAFVRRAVSTILSAAWSRTLWS